MFTAIDRIEQMLQPPAVVDAALQRIAQQYCDGLTLEAHDLFAPLYYSSMRAGFAAAEAVLSVRGVDVGEVEQSVFDERILAITRAWAGLDPWAALSDLAYYLLADLTPAVQQHVGDAIRKSVPNAELPDGWETIPPLRLPRDFATNGVMVAAAAALAAAGLDAL